MDLLQSVVYVFAFSYSQHFFQDQVAGRGLGSSPSYASTSDEAFGWSQSDFLLEFITSVVERVIIIKHRGLSARRCPMPSSPSSSNSFCLLLLGSAPGVVPCPNWQHRPAIPCGGVFSLVCAPWSFSAPGVVPCPNRQPFPGGPSLLFVLLDLSVVVHDQRPIPVSCLSVSDIFLGSVRHFICPFYSPYLLVACHLESHYSLFNSLHHYPGLTSV